MAQRQITELVDDLTGGPAVETIRFGIDGVEYEIELNADNALQLRTDMAPWVDKARRVGGRAKKRGTARTDTDKVRAWGRANGWQVADRGRAPRDLLEAYDAAHA